MSAHLHIPHPLKIHSVGFGRGWFTKPYLLTSIWSKPQNKTFMVWIYSLKCHRLRHVIDIFQCTVTGQRPICLRWLFKFFFFFFFKSWPVKVFLGQSNSSSSMTHLNAAGCLHTFICASISFDFLFSVYILFCLLLSSLNSVRTLLLVDQQVWHP